MGEHLAHVDPADDDHPIPVVWSKHLGPKYETSHTEDWEITFRATVPAGLAARGEAFSAAAILEQRMTEVLHQAGIADPRVQVRKVGRSTHRGTWEGGVQYEAGETCEWHSKLWKASKTSVNRKPPTNPSYWFETSVFHEADALFVPPKELGTGTTITESYTNWGDTSAWESGVVPTADDDVILDAEIVE